MKLTGTERSPIGTSSNAYSGPNLGLVALSLEKGRCSQQRRLRQGRQRAQGVLKGRVVAGSGTENELIYAGNDSQTEVSGLGLVAVGDEEKGKHLEKWKD